MSRSLTVALALALVIVAVNAAIPADLITNLPGIGQTRTKQYSGYVNVDPSHGRYLHYMLAESENNPSSDPIVLWLNGGPGCSSLDGYFYEQGPYNFKSETDSTLVENPNRWNKIANMLYLESPAGVGFSFSETPGDYFTNDTRTTRDAWQFLVSFFQAYPEYAQNDFFIAGESYAGVYIPLLADEIRRMNQAGQSNINLKGIMVGNGCIGSEVGVCGDGGDVFRADFLWGHGLYSPQTRQKIETYCTDWKNPSFSCQSALNQMSIEVDNVNIYDVYGTCAFGQEQNRNNLRAPMSDVGGPIGCIGGFSAAEYLNQANVRSALHVLNTTVLPKWSVCSDSIQYDRNAKSLLPIYPTLIQTYRVLIFNGDVDACVPYNDNQQWTSGLGLPVAQPWHAWHLNQQVAGYATNYQTNGFSFITVRGAGHMVPQTQPLYAFEMLRRFLNNKPF